MTTRMQYMIHLRETGALFEPVTVDRARIFLRSLGEEECCGERAEALQPVLAPIVSHLRRRWANVDRQMRRFERNYAGFLAIIIAIPPAPPPLPGV
jgi:hypothetical protein